MVFLPHRHELPRFPATSPKPFLNHILQGERGGWNRLPKHHATAGKRKAKSVPITVHSKANSHSTTLIRRSLAQVWASEGSAGQGSERARHRRAPDRVSITKASPNPPALCSESHINCGTAVTSPRQSGTGAQGDHDGTARPLSPDGDRHGRAIGHGLVLPRMRHRLAIANTGGFESTGCRTVCQRLRGAWICLRTWGSDISAPSDPVNRLSTPCGPSPERRVRLHRAVPQTAHPTQA